VKKKRRGDTAQQARTRGLTQTAKKKKKKKTFIFLLQERKRLRKAVQVAGGRRGRPKADRN